MAVSDFYLWYQAFERKQEHIKYLLENVGYSSGVSYDYRGGKTNKMYSIVEDEVERIEKLKASYAKIISISFIVSDIMLNLIHENPLGHKIVRAKLNKQDIKKVKGKFNMKECIKAEQQALEYISGYLKKSGVNYYM